MKFSRKRATADVIADFMVEAIPHLPEEAVITHIPTAPSRIRLRGYDQAQLIAQAIAKHVGRGYRPLLRRISNVRQVGATRATRLQQLERAFLADRRYADKNTPIVLVDDVTTTGGTLISATKELRRAGYKNIYASIFCQKD
jgi:predicted amidophosphoribosyltransferase